MKLYFAPLEGVAGYIFRNAFVHHYGGADRYFTPFLSNPILSHKERNDVLPENNAASPLIPQILANNSEYFLEIAKTLKDLGYSEVNLNLGCPSGTVVSKKRGAGFLSVPDSLDTFLGEIFEKCPLKISLKTRIGMEDISEWPHLLEIFAKYPFSELIIHPRLRRELYGGSVHRDAFKTAFDYLVGKKDIEADKLVYNGDICSAEDFSSLTAEFPELTKVMIGRGALKNPEIFNILHGKGEIKDPKEKLDTFYAYHDELFDSYRNIMYGEKPVLFKMKELWGWFSEYAGLEAKELKSIRKATNFTAYTSTRRQFQTQAISDLR